MSSKTDPFMNVRPELEVAKATCDTVIFTVAEIWDAVCILSKIDLDSVEAYQDRLSLYETTFEKAQRSNF